MIARIDRTFENDTDKIKDKNVRKLIADCIDEVQIADKIRDIKQLKNCKVIIPIIALESRIIESVW